MVWAAHMAAVVPEVQVLASAVLPVFEPVVYRLEPVAFAELEASGLRKAYMTGW